MADDDDFFDDDEYFIDDADPADGPTGAAAVLHRTAESLAVHFTFADSLDEALRLAEQPCDINGCFVHEVAARDHRGELHVMPTEDLGGEELRRRIQDASAAAYAAKAARYKAIWSATQAKLGLLPPPEEDDDDG
jgi:hypothetical protein